MKKYLFYIIYVGLFLLFILGALSYRHQLQEQADTQFEVLPLMIFDHVYPIVFGMLVATSFLWNRYKEGRLKGFVWAEFLIIGIPSLYVALAPWLYFTNVPLLPLLKFFATHHYSGPMLFGFLFGFTLIHSIRKKTTA